MASTAYRRGRQFEYRCRKLFQELGYLVVRSPQSRSPFDLIAIAPQRVLLVQCKIGGSLPWQPWNQLFDLAKSIDGIALLALRKGRKLELRELLGWKNEKGRAQPMAILTMEGLRCERRQRYSVDSRS